MNMLQRVEHWGDTHSPNWLSAVRILLGVFLMGMGVLFVMDRDALVSMISQRPTMAAMSIILGHYIVFAHTVGGLFIAMGLVTRFSVIVNIPILLGAVFFVHSPTRLFNVYPSTGLAIIVLLLLIVFLVEGSGRISVDDYMRRHPEKRNHKYIDF
ncbi:DoxX family protein [Chitinophaga eiseniae]|uniref:DoxX family protein n=1 Tax=Chitinophaga eiseniae TaxID=634771 RepID=A0A847SDK9_9BACT|nr:DoxX family protein [Chitinophaga eiseniae]NLR77843.1 DoxX family protein [Chitinophaga eiseniae]